jgi:uncharacterized protein (DUF1015 family)
MSDPGFALPAPVAAGASTPAGAPVPGVAVAGGGTCTLSKGLSWALTPPEQTTAKAQAQTTNHALRDDLRGASSQMEGNFMRSYLGMMASLARSAGALRSVAHTLPSFDGGGLKSVIGTGIQSTLSHSLGGTFPVETCRLNSALSAGSKTFRMASIYPFRAWRYNPSTVRLEDVVTQPYDKISPAMQEAYYQRSPYNLVRIILGLPELFDAEHGENVYTRAARDFRAWRDQSVLVQERDPSIFAYSQRFRVPGTDVVKERRGFIALGKLHEYADQVVFRHEQTLSKPKSDRLNLLKATHAHFGQIFMLYSDPAGSVERILYDGAGPADAEVTDEYNVLHRVWRVSDPAVIRLLISTMADKKLIIADGHHRYETALNYSKQHVPASPTRTEHNANELPQPAFPESAVMMTFVNMDADGLVILPTHRVVHSLSGFDPAAFSGASEQFFTVEKLPHSSAATYISKLRHEKDTAFVAVTRIGAFLLRSKPDASAAALAALPENQRQLDLSHLHGIIFDRLLGLDADKVREQTNLRYLRDAAEAVDQVQRGEADVTFLTNPVTMEQLREVAFAGSVMPQKSTDFFPKLLSGLAIYALE